MKIGYEAKRVFFNNTGLGNYSRGVIKAIASRYPENQYFLYTPEIIPSAKVEFIKNNKSITVVTPKSTRFSGLWRTKFVVKDLKNAGIEVYHGLSHEIPLGISQTNIKSVVTIHDLIVKIFPKYFGFINRKIYDLKLNYACKHADKIIAVSDRTKQDLISFLNIDAQKIDVIYQSCDPIFKVSQSDRKKAEVRLKYNLPKKYILNIGTIEERKNLLLLVKAFKLLPNDTRLVIIGKETAYSKMVRRYAVKNQLSTRISFLPNVNFSDLPVIYQLADLFVYPSRYEGFGIPILEALVSETPVIAATGSCLEEAGGPDSLYVDPDNEQDLANKITKVLSNPALQQTMKQKGKIYAQQFESEILADQLMQLYKKVVNHA